MTAVISRLVTLCLLALTAFEATRAEERGIAARVNGVAISAERLERYQEEVVGGRDFLSMSNPARFKRHKREALEQLIDQELLWQEAQRRRALASRADVEAAMALLRARHASEAEFTRRLENAGFTPAAYEEHLLRLLSIQRFVERDLSPRLTVTDEEVHAHYAADPARFAVPEAEAAPAIRRKLLGEKLARAVAERVAALRAEARIEIALAL